MMSSKNQPSVKTFADLKALHFKSLTRFGLTKRMVELLSIISLDLVNGTGVSPAFFHRDHRRDLESILWLQDKQFITARDDRPYEPQFNAFCAILVCRKKVADALFGQMKRLIRRALDMWQQDPSRLVIPYDEFVATLPASAYNLPALKLLSSSPLGIHVNTQGDTKTVQFSENTRKGKDLLKYVNSYVEMIMQPSPFGSSWSQSTAGELSTFSLSNLLLAKESHKHALRALEQYRSAPDTAISSAKSALESTLKYIAYQEGIEVQNGVKLPELLNRCKQACGLGSEPSHKMSRSIASLCTEIAEARNLLGDSHGKPPGAVSPTRSEARFIVGVALHLSECLLERYDSRRKTA
jgi:Abortive infection C-terminus